MTSGYTIGPHVFEPQAFWCRICQFCACEPEHQIHVAPDHAAPTGDKEEG